MIVSSFDFLFVLVEFPSVKIDRGPKGRSRTHGPHVVAIKNEKKMIEREMKGGRNGCRSD